ncbi:MAG TPA: trypsin-like peptidase domain-containing protein, partial [Tissierellaceae bacterium]|nr:trypsin-like peptidase domain-containing protein [Tissierellaceae bacterium]
MYDDKDYLDEENQMDLEDSEEIEEDFTEDVHDEKDLINDKEPKRKKSFRGSLISYLALAIVASLLGGIASAYIGPSLYGKILPNPKSNEYVSQPVNIATSDDINTVSAVVKKAMGSVVGITTLETRQYPFQQRDVEGLGSGVIVDRNGYILTNSHVVANGKAKEITVLFDNGDNVSGKVLWNDPILDLAIVKVDITNLPAATLGDSDELEVGEIAIAIGNPLGLEFQRTVTSGIISGLNRSIKIDQNTVIDDLIQTDASINPGNSGGPLLNKNGEVIGINTAKIQSGEGLGFSIPINTAKSIIEEVISKGSYETVELGITGLDINEYQARLGID